MKSNEVTRRQARIVKGRLQPTPDYVTRLRQRMAALGFSQDDGLMDLVSNAQAALHALCVELLIRTEQELAETTLVAAALRAGGAMTHGTHTLE
jgi:hypothetical protein